MIGMREAFQAVKDGIACAMQSVACSSPRRFGKDLNAITDLATRAAASQVLGALSTGDGPTWFGERARQHFQP